MEHRVKANDGYYRIYNDETQSSVYEHRLVYERMIGKIPEGFHIHHIDGNRGNNDISNLMAIDGRIHNSLEMRRIRKMMKEDVTAKMLETRSKHGSCRSMKVKCIETGKIYDSITEASREFEGSRQNIVNALNGRQAKAFGYHWEYV